MHSGMMFLRRSVNLLGKIACAKPGFYGDKIKVLSARGNHVPRSMEPVRPAPEIPLEELPMYGTFNQSVCEFISKRDYENKHSRRLAWVTAFDSEDPLGMVQLNDYVFGENPRIDILQRVVVWQRAKARQGRAFERHKSEMPGGGRKPWKQKGTGKARQGSIRAPHFVGGGKAHPKKPRSYNYHLPFKIRMMGIRVALSVRYAQGDLHIVDNFDSVQTEADLLPVLHYRGWNNCLLIDRYPNENLEKAAENTWTVNTCHSKDLSVYEILLRHKTILTLDAVYGIEENFCILDRPVFGYPVNQGTQSENAKQKVELKTAEI